MIIIFFVKLTHKSHHKLVSPRFKLCNHKSKSKITSINMQLERPSCHRLCLKMGAKVEVICPETAVKCPVLVFKIAKYPRTKFL